MKILRDVQEKKGFWTFGKQNPCKTTYLKTGDYTLEGLEDVLAIERKKTVSEFHQNISKKDSVRFWKSINRLSKFKYPYVIFEFSVQDLMAYPFNMPRHIRKFIKVRGSYLMTKVDLIESKNIKVIFAGNRENAINIAYSIFEEIYRNE